MIKKIIKKYYYLLKINLKIEICFVYIYNKYNVVLKKIRITI